MNSGRLLQKRTRRLSSPAVLIAHLFALLIFGGATYRIVSEPSNLFVFTDVQGRQKKVESLSDWQQKRQQILAGMQKAMGHLPYTAGLPVPKMQVGDTLRGDNYTRYSISLTVAENESLPAYLYIPAMKGQAQKRPAMLVLHGTDVLGKGVVDGQSAKANRAHAKELAQRGYIVIAPDYPSFGDLKDYDFENDRYESGTMKAIFNHMRCVDYLQSRADVDAGRIGVLGHSLGGHNAMFAAAFDTRLKVTVASCGWTLMDYYNIGEEASKKYGGRLGPWAQTRYMPWLREKYNLDPEKVPFDFHEIIAAIAPRAFFSNSPLNDSNFDIRGVKIGAAAVTEVYKWLKAEEKFKIIYPDAAHDFPPEARLQAYRFVDKTLNHTPNNHSLLH